MLTASGNTLGSWNGLRPITINNTSGAVSIGNGLNVTGGVNGSLNGNASTATKLQTARKISGVSFDGSADITLTAANVSAFARRATGTYADADGGVPRMPNQALTMSPALATPIFWLTSIPESEVAGPCR